MSEPTKTPAVNHANIIKSYKTDWYVTETEIAELRQNYVFNNQPVRTGDLYGGMYIGIAFEDFEKYRSGNKDYRVIVICESIMNKIRK